MKAKTSQINVHITAEEKRKLQDLANLNTDGNIRALIKMFIHGEVVKRS